MAQDCSQDLVRALVEETLDGDERARTLEHVDSCVSCRKLRSRLEKAERRVRAAIEEAGEGDVAGECPTPAELAAWTEQQLQGEDYTRVEEHVALCALCRGSSAIAASSAIVDVPSEALEAARRRLAAARGRQTRSKTPTGRRKRGTGRHAAVPVAAAPARGMGFWIAVAAALLVAIGLFAFHETATNESPVAQKPDQPTATPSSAPTNGRHSPDTRTETPEPAREQAPSPDTSTQHESTPAPENPTIARNPPAEPEPEEDDGRHSTAPRGIGTPLAGGTPGPVPRPTSDRPSHDPAKPEGTKQEGPVVACAVEGLSGPIEVRRKDGTTWHGLAASDSLKAGDAIRAKGQDASLTVAGRAKIQLDADTLGTIAFTTTGVKLTVESGGLDGEAIARDGLEVASAHGCVTVWSGSKVRVEASDQTLRVLVDSGRARVQNDLGKVMLNKGQETQSSKGEWPHPASLSRGPRRSSSHGR